MVELVGTKTAGATAEAAVEKKGFAGQREVTAAGLLHELKFTTEATSKAEGIKLGIRKDEAGAVGAFIAETAEIVLVKETAQTVGAVLEGGDVLLLPGKYWLCVIAVKGTNLKWKGTTKAGEGFKTTGAVTKVSEGTWTTAEEKMGAPAPIWGEGELVAPSPVWNFRPPTFFTPSGLYKPFPPAPTEVLDARTGKATGELLLIGTSKGTAVQVVAAKATGTLFLIGTSKGLAVQVVQGKATGTLFLTGTSTGTTKAVVSGKATGTLFLTGTSTGTAVQVVRGKATGTLFLTGTSKGSVSESSVIEGKAKGTLLLTGVSSGRISIAGAAQGALLLTGTSKGTATKAGGRVTIFIFEE